MPTISPQVTPYYGGGQVVNPADVIQVTATPSAADISHNLGTIAVQNSNGHAWMLTSKVGGTAGWEAIGGGGLSVATLTGGSGGAISPVAGNIDLLGTANQIVTTGTAGTITWSLPATVVAPGSIAATTTLTATLGAITATNGNLVLGTAGNKVVIATGANASVGTSEAMTAGAVTVTTTASSATAKIFYSRATTGGTAGEVSITAQDGTGFTLTSSSNTETSTFNWWIINA